LIWYDDPGLTNQVGMGIIFIPNVSQLDMAVIAITEFYVTQLNGCVEGQAETVIVGVKDCSIPCPVVTIQSMGSICFLANGEITVSLTGGTAPFEFIIDDGSSTITQTNGNFPNLLAGSYDIQVRDGNGCVFNQTVVLANSINTVIAVASNFVDAQCFNDIDGGSAMIDVTSGGADPYEYSIDGNNWIEFNSGETIFGLPSNGTYNINIRDDINDTCPSTVSVTINKPISGFIANILVGTLSFSNLNSGTIPVMDINGGTPPYQVQAKLINPLIPGQVLETALEDVLFDSISGQNNFTFEDLFAGDYEITVSDINGCMEIFTGSVGLDLNLMIPNVFTPNNDGFNDTFFVINLPEDGASLTITNRWGKILFQSNSYQNDWNAGGLGDGMYFFEIVIGGIGYTGWVEVLKG